MNYFTKNRMMIIAVVILVILNIITISMLWFPRHMRTPAHHSTKIKKQPNVERYLERQLKLSSEQINDFKKLRADHFRESRELIGEIQELKQKMFTHLSSGHDNEAEVDDITRALGQKQAALELATYNHFKALWEICDDTQKKRFDKVIHTVMRRMHDAHGPQRRQRRSR
ncbi:periplasmic heavy metal sensor [Fulvivirgaceae bacterium BMA10]|uniref:Periplasmic heavy metal sensor n=1 Tax=Splendidivirga corallicola TaxID=3051826 RepID=A0ABT8KVG4_9BACT|nr:periplasmic heavy metal sensor [Fulvivirgaceae bacterium BMA10]